MTSLSSLPPLVESDVTFADVMYEADTVRVTLQLSITNERGTPSVEVSPPVSLGYVETNHLYYLLH